MKRLILCPVCREKGIINILGEVVEDGFIIKRFHKGETKIISEQFIVVCGNCNENIFFRRKPTVILRSTVVNYIHDKNRIQGAIGSTPENI